MIQFKLSIHIKEIDSQGYCDLLTNAQTGLQEICLNSPYRKGKSKQKVLRSCNLVNNEGYSENSFTRIIKNSYTMQILIPICNVDQLTGFYVI